MAKAEGVRPARPEAAAPSHERRARGDGDVLRWALIVLAVAALAALVWALADVLLLGFGAVLFALVLRGLAEALARRVPLGERGALAVVVVLLLAAIGGVFWLFGAQLAAQFDELSRILPDAIGRAEALLAQHSWGPWALEQIRGIGGAGSGLAARITKVLGTTIGFVSEALLMFVAGIYLAAQPKTYRGGLLALVPAERVGQAQRVLAAMARALRLWLFGQGIAMLLIGTLTTVGLLLLGMPSALALGLIAGMTEFIPIFGPIIGAVPAVLIAFGESPTMALWVMLFYFGLQQLENHLLMPLIQNKVASVPPVLTLFATVVAGLLFGALGILFATPLAVAAVVAVQILYVEGMLGKDVEVLGEAALRD
jgi:predicted PurR-regulated permease PerM